MNFPCEPEDLQGQQVLLILLSGEHLERAHFMTGLAVWTGHALHVHAPRAGVIVVDASRAALRGFDPALPPRLIMPDALPSVSRLGRGVDACVVVQGEHAPSSALSLDTPFFGVATGAERQVYLMQGSPETTRLAVNDRSRGGVGGERH